MFIKIRQVDSEYDAVCKAELSALFPGCTVWQQKETTSGNAQHSLTLVSSLTFRINGKTYSPLDTYEVDLPMLLSQEMVDLAEILNKLNNKT